MDWARDYYTRQSETFARAVVTDAHRRIAQRLHTWCAAIDGCRRVLELGAGNGGTAAALADLGYDVTAVEFNPSDAALARQLAAAPRSGAVDVVEADFYEVRFDEPFDFVFYWDGFGIGTDADQRRLLARIGLEWLRPRGRAVIDVFSPWNWQRRDGERSERTARDGRAWEHLVEFDAVGNRLVDRWRPAGTESSYRTQTIRCYSVPDFVMLLEHTGTRLDGIYGMDGAELDVSSGSAPVNAALLDANGFFALLARTDEDA
jgi:SAM-dependent methyltransferase